jgi:glycosyltransferase involved in cell wall biosynthesis
MVRWIRSCRTCPRCPPGSDLKITLLSHDVSLNCMGRAHVLARLLVPEHDVEIIGPASSGEIWEPLREDDVVPIRVIPNGRLRDMAAYADGDVLYSVKERPTSLGVALAAKRERNRPLLADVDDWEMGFLLDDAHAMVRSRFRDETKWVARTIVDVRKTNNLYRTAWTERQVRKADAVTVSSGWLAKRFGGSVIVHSRDTDVLDPALSDRDQARADLGIAPETTVLLFMGSPRRHKGINTVVEALDRLGRDDIVFMIVGGDPGIPPRPDVRYMGWQPFGDVNRFLVAADIVVLAQAESPATKGQMPAKVYDAMAMRCALIVTDVSDLAATVEGCGLVVPPGDPAALAAAITTLADDPELRRRLGANGRERCLSQFSDEAVRPKLLSVLDRVLSDHRRARGA